MTVAQLPADVRMPAGGSVAAGLVQSFDDATNTVSVKGNITHGFSATFNIVVNDPEVTAKGSLSRPSSGGGPPQAGG